MNVATHRPFGNERLGEIARAILAEREALAPKLVASGKLTQDQADANLALWRRIVQWAETKAAGVALFHPTTWPWEAMCAEADRLACQLLPIPAGADQKPATDRILLATRLAASADLNRKAGGDALLCRTIATLQSAEFPRACPELGRREKAA